MRKNEKKKWTKEKFFKEARITGVVLYNAIRTVNIILEDDDTIDINNQLNKGFLAKKRIEAQEKDNNKYKKTPQRGVFIFKVLYFTFILLLREKQQMILKLLDHLQNLHLQLIQHQAVVNLRKKSY